MKTTTKAKLKTSNNAWTFTLLLTLVVGFYFLKSFIPLIMLATLFAFFTNPIYEYCMRKFKKSGLSAFLTTLALFLIIAIPTFIVIFVAIDQAITLSENLGLGELANSENVEQSGVELVNEINEIISGVTGTADTINADSVSSFIESTLPSIVNALVDSLLAIISSIPAFFMNLIIFIFVYVGILTNSEKLVKTIRSLSPFDDKINDLYLKRIGLMANAMLKGQFFIATMQGLATAIGLAIIGLEEYFSFFFLIFTFMSLIPLGAGIITIPLGIFLILIGDVWQGVLVLANHFIIVTNIDNIRPKLVPKEARMQAALTILAAFAGVSFWGVLGVIYGPIVMIILVTAIETYIKVKDQDAPALQG